MTVEENKQVAFETVENANPASGFIKGDVVKMYKEGTELLFPCLVLSCTELENFRVDALSGLLTHQSLVSDAVVYHVYIALEGELIGIGQLPNKNLKAVLSNQVFRVFDKVVHMTPTNTVKGDMLYALCTTTGK